MNGAIFKFFGEIGIKTAEAEKGLQDVSNKASNAAQGIGNTFKKVAGVIGAAFAAIQIVDLGKQAIQVAADFKAMEAQFDQVFKGMEESARSTINTMSEEFGIMDTRLQPIFTSLTSKYKGLGMSAEEAMSLAQRTTTSAADAAAYYDISMEEAQSALNSFINGNVEAGEKIGLFANQTQLANKAVEAGLISQASEWAQLGEAQKQAFTQDYIDSIYEANGAMGQAARESDGLENVMGNLRAAWAKFLVVIGSPLLEAVVPILQKLTEWILKAADAVQPLADAFSDMLVKIDAFYDMVFGSRSRKENTDMMEQLGISSEDAAKVADFAESVRSSIDKITGAVTSFYDVIFGSRSMKDNSDFMEQLGISPKTAQAIVKVADAIGRAIDKIKEIFEDWFNVVEDAVSEPLAELQEWFEDFKETLDGFTLEDVINWFTELYETVEGVFQNMEGVVDSFIQPFVDKFKRNIDIVKEMFSGIFTAFQQAMNGDWEGALTTFKETMSTSIGNVITNTLESWAQLWQNMQDLIGQIDWNGVATTALSALGYAFQTGVSFLGDIGNTIKNWIFTTTGAQSWGDVAQSILNGISSAISTVWGMVTGVGTAIKTWIFDSTGAQSWSDVAQTVLDGINSAISGAGEFVADIGTTIKKWIFNKLGATSWQEVGDKIIEMIAGAIRTASEKITEIVIALVSMLNKESPSSSELQDFTEGILNAIIGALNFLGTLLTAVADAIIVGIVNGATGADYTSLDDIAKGIGDYLEGLDWASMVKGVGAKIVNGIVASVKDFFTFGNIENPLTEDDILRMFDPNSATPNSNPGRSGTGNSNRGGSSRNTSRVNYGGLGGNDLGSTGKEYAPGSMHYQGSIDFSGLIAQVRSGMEQIKATIANYEVGIQNQFRTLFSNLTPTFEQAKLSLASSMRSLMEQMKLTIAEGQIGLQNQFRTLFMSLNPTLEMAKLSLATSMRSIMEQLKLTIAEGQIGLQNQFRVLFTSLNPTFEQAKMTAAQHMRSYIEQMKSIIGAGQQGVINQLRTIFTLFIPVYDQARTTATQKMRALTEALKSGIASGQQGVVNQVNAMMNAAVNAINSYSGRFHTAGYNLGVGMYNGLASQRGAIVSLANNIASSAANAIQSRLRIASPSKVGYYLFEMLGKGLYNGLEAWRNKIINLVSSIVDIPNEMDLDFGSTATLAGNINIPMSNQVGLLQQQNDYLRTLIEQQDELIRTNDEIARKEFATYLNSRRVSEEIIDDLNYLNKAKNDRDLTIRGIRP